MTMNPALLDMVRKTKGRYSSSMTKTVKPKEGKTMIRVLGKIGDVFWSDLGVHWIKTEKNGKPVAVVGCHEATYEKACPVCEAIAKATASAADDETLNLIKEWKAKKVVLIPALIRNGPDKSESPQILELTGPTWGKVWSLVETYAEAGVDAFDLKDGIDFIIERTGKGFDTEYNIMASPKSFPVDPDVMKNLPDIEAYIQKEFFLKNDEPKALRAIGSVMGTAVSGAGGAALVAGGSARSAPALSGPGAVVHDAEIAAALAELEAPATAPAATATAAATPAAKTVAATTAAAPAATTVVEAPATAPTTFGQALPQDEIDAMLAELDGK